MAKNVTWTWHHAANGCVDHLSPSLPLTVSSSQAVNTNVLNLCSCVFFPFIIVFLQGPYFCFVQQNKAVWKRQEMRCVIPMLKVKPCLSVLWCKYFYDCKLNTLMVMLKALIIFDKQMRRKLKKKNLKRWLIWKLSFDQSSFWVYFAVPPWGHFKL